MKRKRLTTADRDKLVLQRLSKMGMLIICDEAARKEFIEELFFYDLRLTLRYRRKKARR